MARPLRYLPESTTPTGTLVEITMRTFQGRMLLRPSRQLNDLILGVLGRAQKMFQVAIHAFTFLSNHYHMLLSVGDAQQLASFMAFVNGNIAREAGRLHGWRERFWGRRYRAIVIADSDEVAQVARLRYVLVNGCKEGLVASPRDWPGASSTAALLSGQRLVGSWIDRTSLCRARLKKGQRVSEASFTTSYEVRLTPLPCWQHLDGTTRRRACAELVSEIERETAAANAEQRRRPLGRERILRQHPHEAPRHPERSPAPLVHAISRAARKAFFTGYRAFVDAYRAAAAALKRGIAGVEFPRGAFPPPAPFRRLAEA